MLNETEKAMIVAALQTQWLGLQTGSVYEEEAGGDAAAIKALAERLGADTSSWEPI